MAPSRAAVLDAVARRLRQDPDRVLPTLRLLADPDALPGPEDRETVVVAERVNTARLAARRVEFRSRALPSSEVRRMLGVSRQALAARVAGRKLLALQFGGVSYFPDWQFGPDGLRPGVTRLVPALLADGRGVLAADALMRNPLPEAGKRSPADLLADGDVDTALHYVTAAGF